ERLVPRHARPPASAPLSVTAQRVENPVRILELIRRDHALRAGAAAAARMQRVALDLADGQLFLVDIGKDAAGRLAVEADAGDDPVAAFFFFRPAGGLV